MPTQADIEVRIFSQPVYLGVVRAMLETTCGRYGLGANETAHVVMAVDEALANVMRHGYQGRDDGPIWIGISPLGDDANPGIEIRIRDECSGVDINRIRGRDLDKVRPGGLGVHIMHSTMDEVIFRRRDEQDGEGIELIMRKHRERGLSRRDAVTPATGT